MRTVKRVIGVVGGLAVAVPAGLVLATPAAAHGSMDNPVSRSYLCYQEGPESPTSEVCKAVVAANGTQPLYDWMEVNIADAAGRHQQIIPDGGLCSAGRDKYSGLDVGRSDWPATELPEDGSSYTFTFRATAPHAGGFEIYVTKDGYDPNQPLRWSDLESTPFHAESDPRLVDGSYVMDVTLPDKQGRHLIYAIWQRTDSPEAFYSCSDVVFGAGDDAAAPAPPPPAPDPEEDDGAGGGDGAGEDGECHEDHAGDDAAAEESGAHDDGAGHRHSHHRHGSGEWGKFGKRDRDDVAAASATIDEAAGSSSFQPAIAGIAAAALGAALLLARPTTRGVHRRRGRHAGR